MSTCTLQVRACAWGPVRSCWAGVLVGIFDAAFASSSLILSVSWDTRDLKYAISSEAEVIGDVLVGMLVDGKQGLAFDNSKSNA